MMGSGYFVSLVKLIQYPLLCSTYCQAHGWHNRPIKSCPSNVLYRSVPQSLPNPTLKSSSKCIVYTPTPLLYHKWHNFRRASSGLLRSNSVAATYFGPAHVTPELNRLIRADDEHTCRGKESSWANELPEALALTECTLPSMTTFTEMLNHRQCSRMWQ